MCPANVLAFVIVMAGLAYGFVWPAKVWNAPGNPGINEVRKATRLPGILSWLGAEVRCAGCPMHGCEDDAAIIHGYCCGCAMREDQLPVTCPTFLDCPLNSRGLCRDYEYMLRCCC